MLAEMIDCLVLMAHSSSTRGVWHLMSYPSRRRGGAMRVPRQVACVVLTALGMTGFSAARSSTHAQAQREMLAWAPMPTTPSQWVAPNRPHWKLSELLAKHKGAPNWTETVVSDNTLHAE